MQRPNLNQKTVKEERLPTNHIHLQLMFTVCVDQTEIESSPKANKFRTLGLFCICSHPVRGIYHFAEGEGVGEERNLALDALNKGHFLPSSVKLRGWLPTATKERTLPRSSFGIERLFHLYSSSKGVCEREKGKVFQVKNLLPTPEGKLC